MPGASEEELQQAMENWDAYMALVLGIAERLRKEGQLDKVLAEARIEKERWRLCFLEVLIGVLKQIAAVKETRAAGEPD